MFLFGYLSGSRHFGSDECTPVSIIGITLVNSLGNALVNIPVDTLVNSLLSSLVSTIGNARVQNLVDPLVNVTVNAHDDTRMNKCDVSV